MVHSTKRLRGALLAAAGIAPLTFGAAPSLAAEPATTEQLQAQVQQLTALVQSLAQRDQQQIEALSQQVKSLQAQLKQKDSTHLADQPVPNGAASSGRAALTRTAENTLGVLTINDEFDEAIALPRVAQNATHRFAIVSSDGQYSISLTGNVQFDTGGYVGFHPGSRIVGPQDLSNGVNARRARIGITGTAAKDWGFSLIYDAGNSSDQTAKGIETAQIIYKGVRGAAFEIGYSNTFFTLDQSTTSYDTLFLERASPSNIATNFNTGDARANAGVRFFGDRYWIGGYLTGPASGNSHTLTGERFGAFERIAVQALKGPNYSLHLGFGVDELLRASNTGNGTADTLTLNDQPELRIDPTTLLNTGVIGSLTNPVTGGHVLDFETAATYGPFFWQGEYFLYEVSRRKLADANFEGGYGQISWTLTGETHAYNPQVGAYYRIMPKHPFSLKNGGWGAWEVAARASYVDLTSNFQSGVALSSDPAAVDGGLQRSYTLGLNWYPNDLVRFLFDYNHVNYNKANGLAIKGAALGAPIGANLDAVSLRAQVAY